VLERLKLLQAVTIAFQETNLEWHNKGYRDEFQKIWSRPLVQQGWIAVQQKISLKHRRLNQEGLQVQSWVKWFIAW
jgi:hypothetical protein